MSILVYLIGRSGTGKYSIAKELSERNFKIVDNHLINNPIFSLLETSNLNSSVNIPIEAWNAIGKIRNIVFDYLGQEKANNYILTNELFDNDEGDRMLFEQVKNLSVTRGSLFLPVILHITKDENEKRISSPVRVERYKSIRIDEKDWTRDLIKIDHPNLLEIEVSNLSAKAAAEIITNHITKF